jgi:heterodisulfide reductase subunit C
MASNPGPPKDAPGASGTLRPGDRTFLAWVEKEADTSVSACYQCQKCTSGCPIAAWMDHYPHQVVRMIELGMVEEVLTSRTIWLCADCKTCVTRCPNNVDIPAFMEVLKRRSQKEGRRPGEENIPIFQKAFLDSIEKKGRMHELGMMRQYKMKSGDLFSDIKLGFSMFRKGKLKIFGGKVKGVKEIRKIFEQARKED